MSSCAECGTEFERIPNQKRFCSRSCASKYGARISAKSAITKQCEKCDREIRINNYERHLTACQGKKQGVTLKEEWKQKNGNYKCPFCGAERRRAGICFHVWRKHTLEGQQFNLKEAYAEPKVAWNKGLTEKDHLSVKQNSDSLRKGYESGRLVNAFKGKQHTKEAKKSMSQKAKQRGLGGRFYRKVFKHKRKDDKIVLLDSSYELKVAKDLDKYNIFWERPKPFIWFDSNGEDHRYYPDFYLVDFDVYLDPKNDYLIQKDQDKIKRVQKQNKIKVIILNSQQLEWVSIQKMIA